MNNYPKNEIVGYLYVLYEIVRDMYALNDGLHEMS